LIAGFVASPAILNICDYIVFVGLSALNQNLNLPNLKFGSSTSFAPDMITVTTKSPVPNSGEQAAAS
jgi:hypothetical protein